MSKQAQKGNKFSVLQATPDKPFIKPVETIPTHSATFINNFEPHFTSPQTLISSIFKVKSASEYFPKTNFEQLPDFTLPFSTLEKHKAEKMTKFLSDETLIQDNLYKFAKSQFTGETIANTLPFRLILQSCEKQLMKSILLKFFEICTWSEGINNVRYFNFLIFLASLVEDDQVQGKFEQLVSQILSDKMHCLGVKTTMTQYEGILGYIDYLTQYYQSQCGNPGEQLLVLLIAILSKIKQNDVYIVVKRSKQAVLSENIIKVYKEQLESFLKIPVCLNQHSFIYLAQRIQLLKFNNIDQNLMQLLECKNMKVSEIPIDLKEFLATELFIEAPFYSKILYSIKNDQKKLIKKTAKKEQKVTQVVDIVVPKQLHPKPSRSFQFVFIISLICSLIFIVLDPNKTIPTILLEKFNDIKSIKPFFQNQYQKGQQIFYQQINQQRTNQNYE